MPYALLSRIISSAMRAPALDAVLPLVVGGNRAIGTGKLAPEGQDKRADRAQLADLVVGQRLRAQRGPAARRFQQTIARDRVGQFIEIADETLYAGVDELFGHMVAISSGVDEAGDVF